MSTSMLMPSGTQTRTGYTVTPQPSWAPAPDPSWARAAWFDPPAHKSARTTTRITRINTSSLAVVVEPQTVSFLVPIGQLSFGTSAEGRAVDVPYLLASGP